MPSWEEQSAAPDSDLLFASLPQLEDAVVVTRLVTKHKLLCK